MRLINLILTGFIEIRVLIIHSQFLGSPGSPSSSPPTSVSGSVIADGNRSNLKSLDENSNAANMVGVGRGSIGGPPGLTSLDRRVGSISPASMDSNQGSGTSHELDHSLGQSVDRASKSKTLSVFSLKYFNNYTRNSIAYNVFVS